MNGTDLEIGLRMARHIWSNRLVDRKNFPVVTMLEPLEACNLSCKGCGRIIEYRESVIVKKKMLSVDECINVVRQADTPVVSIAGGEPLIHPQIDEIVAGILDLDKYVFLCTNGLLMEQGLQRIPADKRFCWVVHLDGMADAHDYWVQRRGIWDKAIHAIQLALENNYRVCTNTTVYRGSDAAALHQLFRFLTELGVEGIMISAGFPYETIPIRDIFIERKDSFDTFREVLDNDFGFRFYNNPLYLDFLRGREKFPCRAWTTPTFTPLGWRKPCYLIVDEHVDDLNELMEPSLWENYGPGRDERCATCTMHSGFEAGIIIDSFSSPGGFLRLAGSYLRQSLQSRRLPSVIPLSKEKFSPGD